MAEFIEHKIEHGATFTTEVNGEKYSGYLKRGRHPNRFIGTHHYLMITKKKLKKFLGMVYFSNEWEHTYLIGSSILSNDVNIPCETIVIGRFSRSFYNVADVKGWVNSAILDYHASQEKKAAEQERLKIVKHVNHI